MKRTSAGKQRKFLAARILCSLLLGMYLVSGYNLPVARGEGTAVGPGASAGHDSSTAVGKNANASGENSTAVGNGAIAQGNSAVAAGSGSSASNLSSVAIGYGAKAKGNRSLALASGAEAGGYTAAAAGYTANAGGDYSLAFGYEANAAGKYAFALGFQANAGAMNSVAVGSSAKAAQGAIAFGSEVKAGGIYSIGVGYGANPSGEGGVAFGVNSKAGDYAVAVGHEANASAANSVAFGHSSKAEAENSFSAVGGVTGTAATNSAAIGNGARVTVADTVALGSGSVASREKGATDAYLKGSNTGSAWVSTHNAIAVGDDATVTRQITGVAAGSKDTDAVNVAQLKAVGDAKLDKTEFAKLTNSEGNGRVDVIETAVSGITTAVDGKANATLDNITEAGKTVVKDLARKTVNVVGEGPVSVAKSDVSGVDTYKVSVKTDGKVESGDKGIVTGGKVYDYFHGDILALGKGSEATGTHSIAIGYGNKVSGSNSGAFGDPNTVSGSGSYAIGNNNTISGDNTFVLGNNVKTSAKNAVVLGDGSEGADNAVSVGAKGKERQIKNVAPGTDDSDATTVKQVKEMIEAGGGGADLTPINHRIDNLDSKVNKIGAGAAALAALHPMDTDGKFSMAAGFGNYRDANAMALGVFYRPNDQVMFSMGGSLGNGENMINAGVSFALDKGITTGKAAMAKKIAAQDAKIAMLEGENAEQKAKIRNQDVEIAALKTALARIEAKLGK